MNLARAALSSLPPQVAAEGCATASRLEFVLLSPARAALSCCSRANRGVLSARPSSSFEQLLRSPWRLVLKSLLFCCCLLHRYLFCIRRESNITCRPSSGAILFATGWASARTSFDAGLPAANSGICRRTSLLSPGVIFIMTGSILLSSARKGRSSLFASPLVPCNRTMLELIQAAPSVPGGVSMLNHLPNKTLQRSILFNYVHLVRSTPIHGCSPHPTSIWMFALRALIHTRLHPLHHSCQSPNSYPRCNR